MIGSTFIASHMMLGWIWFLLPVIGWIGGAALVIGIIAALTSTTSLKGKSIGILGMQMAGKTRLLRILQGRPYNNYEGTSTADYDEFKTDLGGEKEWIIQQGRDIGGDGRYIIDYYNSFIQSKDITFFLFNVKKYLQDEEYAKNVRARMEFIYRKLKDKFSSDTDIKAHHVTMATHCDLLADNEKKEMLSKLQASVANKPYGLLFHNNLYAADLTNTNEVRKFLREQIFK